MPAAGRERSFFAKTALLHFDFPGLTQPRARYLLLGPPRPQTPGSLLYAQK